MDRNKTAVPAQKRIDVVYGSVYEDNIAIVQQNSCVLVAQSNVPALVDALLEAVIELQAYARQNAKDEGAQSGV